jgi:hypothetical protein
MLTPNSTIKIQIDDPFPDQAMLFFMLGELVQVMPWTFSSSHHPTTIW